MAGRLGYAEYGDPDGWPLMFFHGTPGSRVMARFAASRAREMGVRLIAPERPGFGLSDVQPQRRLLDWVEDIGELADALNLDRFAVAGVSGGGPYVAACAWKMGTRLVAAGIVSGLAPADRVRRELNWLHRLSAVLVRRAALVNLVLGLLARSARHHPEWIIRSMCLVAPWGDRKILSQPEVRVTQIDGISEAFRRGAQGAAAELDSVQPALGVCSGGDQSAGASVAWRGRRHCAGGDGPLSGRPHPAVPGQIYPRSRASLDFPGI